MDILLPKSIFFSPMYRKICQWLISFLIISDHHLFHYLFHSLILKKLWPSKWPWNRRSWYICLNTTQIPFLVSIEDICNEFQSNWFVYLRKNISYRKSQKYHSNQYLNGYSLKMVLPVVLKFSGHVYFGHRNIFCSYT